MIPFRAQRTIAQHLTHKKRNYVFMSLCVKKNVLKKNYKKSLSFAKMAYICAFLFGISNLPKNRCHKLRTSQKRKILF